jgi:hypothetical protein
VLSLDQRNCEWRTDTPPATGVAATIIDRIAIGQGVDLAVAIVLTPMPTGEVTEYLRSSSAPVAELIALSTADGPSHSSVPDAASAIGWARAARTAIRDAVTETNARRIHLFLAAPAGAALMLGHHWNLMPPTMLYEHLNPGYAPTLSIP